MSRKDSSNPLIGKMVGDRLEIMKLLGAGGMGEVYLARHVSLDVDRAVKVVRADLVSSKQAEARFRREAIALSKLQHENIVRVLDFGRLPDGSLFLVMEHIEGPDLHGRVARQGPLNLVDGLKVLCQVASALEYAHGQGIVHRDLKPANILLQEARPEWVRIIDFGLVKLVSEEMVTKLTKDNQVLGTPLFMAPEQCMGGDVGPAADVYTLAGIAYYLFSGDAVFPGLPPMATVLAHYEKEPERLSDRMPYVGAPEDLDLLLMGCLAKKPEDRPTSSDVLSGIQGILANLSRMHLERDSRPVIASETDREPPRWVAHVIWQWEERAGQEKPETVEEEVVREALINQITAVLKELSVDLRVHLSEADLVAAEMEAIKQAEETVTDLEIEKALVDSQLEEVVGSRTQEEASVLYRQRQLREHVKYLTHGLTQRYMSLYDEVVGCRSRVTDPDILCKYEEMDGLVDQYLKLLSHQSGRG